KAREWYERAVSIDRGGGVAMYRLGRMYDFGLGTAQDYTKARQWYEKAAEAGDADGNYGLAWMSFEGKGVPTDAAKAKSYLDKAVAAGGSADALYSLGYFHETGGPGLTANAATAREWYRKSVAKGSSYGMERLAVLLDEAKGGPADYPGAAEWLLE